MYKDTPDEVLVPCGYCWQCKDTRFKEWNFRLSEEHKNAYNGWFVTLTYDQENIPIITADGEILKGVHNRGSPTIYMPHVSAFIKALRQEQEVQVTKWRKEDKPVKRLKIRFYAVAEYGSETMRPHYHLLIFNLYEQIDIHKVWKKGFVTREIITEGRIKYVSGYNLDKDRYPKTSLKPTTRMSQGIGRAYLERGKKWHIDNEELYSPTGGRKQRLPRYYQERIFSSDKLKELRDKQKEFYDDEEPDYKKQEEQKAQDAYSIESRKRKSKL